MGYSSRNQTRRHELPPADYVQPTEPTPPASTALTLVPDSCNLLTLPFALAGGTPAGGTYTGTGVSGGNFSPLSASIGAHTITYTTGGGSATDDMTIVWPSGMPPGDPGGGPIFGAGIAANEVMIPDATELGLNFGDNSGWTINLVPALSGAGFPSYAAKLDAASGVMACILSGPLPLVDLSSPVPDTLIFARNADDPSDFNDIAANVITLDGVVCVAFVWDPGAQLWIRGNPR